MLYNSVHLSLINRKVAAIVFDLNRVDYINISYPFDTIKLLVVLQAVGGQQCCPQTTEALITRTSGSCPTAHIKGCRTQGYNKGITIT